MKKLNLLFVLSMLALVMFNSCNDGKTYAEYKKDEANAINKYIVENNIKVLTEKEFFDQDSLTKDNEYVLFEETGIYMNIVQPGIGKEILKDGNYTFNSRFVEVAIQDRKDMFSAGDTLLMNMHCNKFPDMLIDPEEFKVTISKDSYMGSFSNMARSKMYSAYQTTAVPSGWLFPLRFIKPTRTTSAAKVARVRLILPHSQGTSFAQQKVYPCYYEITYPLNQ